MVFAAEIVGAFLAGIVFTLGVLALTAKPLSRWAMRRMMKGAFVSTTARGEKVIVSKVETD